MKLKVITGKLESFVEKRRWRRLIYITGFLLVVGFAADHTPWARGWFHHLRWGIRVSPYADWDGLFTGKTSFRSFQYHWHLIESPRMDSMPDKLLQRYSKNYRETVDKWHKEAVKRHPWLQVNFRTVADENNGYLAIHNWMEEDRTGSAGLSFRQYDIPKRFEDLRGKDWFDWKSEMELTPETMGDIGVYLDDNKALLSRAMRIGHMPDRSMKGIDLFEAGFIPISWVKSVLDHLRFKALYEAYQGDEEAALKTLTAIQGWGRHYREVEAPSLISTMIGKRIQLGSVSMAYWDILPLLPGATIHKPGWEALFESNWNYSEQLAKAYGGDWYIFVNHQIPSWVTGYTFGNLPAYLDWYTDQFDSYVNADSMGEIESLSQQPTNHLSVTNQVMAFYFSFGMEGYTIALVRSDAFMHQYEVAFKLRKLEAEGKVLNALDQNTLDSLSLQILPDLRLSIDFEKRLILDPTGKIKSLEPLAF